MGNPMTPAWKGYLLAVLMFLSASLQSLVEQHFMYRVKVLQMRLRTAITGLVYRKVSLRGEGWVFPVPPILSQFMYKHSSQERSYHIICV